MTMSNNIQFNHASQGAGAGVAYLNKPEHERKYKHLRRMLEKCWDYTGAVRFDIDQRFAYNINAITSHMCGFSNDTLNRAHDAACSEYSSRGRPRGSRNKAHVQPTPTTHNSPVVEEYFSDAKPAPSALVVETPKADAPVIPATPPTVHDSADLVTLKMLNKHERANEASFNLVSEKIAALVTNDIHLGQRINDTQNSITSYAARIAALEQSKPTIVEIKPYNAPALSLGQQHKAFPDLLALCFAAIESQTEPLNVWLYGPAGTGKTTAAKNVSKALTEAYARPFPFYALSKLSTEYQILGYQDANGRYVGTLFRQCYEHGGVIILDEIDSWSPNAMTALNGALANGYCAFPDGMIERHPDCVVIAGANTVGAGGTIEYVGRLKQDAASLDRFEMLHWPIDEALEAALTAHPEWLARVRHVRAQVAAKGIKDVMITPRAAIKGAARIRAGVSVEMAERLFLKRGMSDAQWSQVK